MSACEKISTIQAAVYVLVFVIYIFILSAFFYFSFIKKADDSKCSVVPSPVVPAGAKNGIVYDKVDVANPSGNINRVFFPEQWQLARADSGALQFNVSNKTNGSLIVYLVDQPNNRTLADSRGYAVVFDHTRDTPRTFVSAIPGLPSVHPKSRTNKGHRMGPDETTYWIVYEKGTVLVGTGSRPGGPDAKLVTCLQGDDAEAAPTGIKYFGFGSLCQTGNNPIEVTKIRTFDAPDKGCSWTTIVPQRCSPSDTLAASSEMFGENSVPACPIAE